MHLVLKSLGVSSVHSLPLSAGLLCHTNDYFAVLNSFRSGDIKSIVQIVCDATSYALDLAYQMADSLAEIMSKWTNLIH